MFEIQKCHFCKGVVTIKEKKTVVQDLHGPPEEVAILIPKCSLGYKDCPILEIYRTQNKLTTFEGRQRSREAP